MVKDARKNAAGSTAARPGQDSRDVSRLLDGTKLSNVVIRSMIGCGEFGITYLAAETGSDRTYALKEYMPRSIAFRDGPAVRVARENATAFAWGLERFLHEGRTLATIRHDAVVGVHSVLEGNGTAYLLMPYESGKDLTHWLDELGRPPTQQEQDRLVRPLLEGIAMVHEKGLHHLEISPANIRIRDNGAPVLLDFGSVRVGLRQRLGEPTPSDRKAFVAPEVQAGELDLIGPRSDIYSLAAVLYAAATGAPPAAHRALLDEIVPAVRGARTQLRSDYLGGIDAGLALRPEDRPQNIAGWQTTLMRRADMKTPIQDDADKPKAANDHASLEPMEAKGLFNYPDDDVRDVEKSPGQHAENIMDHPGVRTITYVGLGALGGALAGALSSVVVASILWSSCFADSCIMPILPHCTVAGTVIGAWLASRHAKATAAMPDRRPPGGMA